MWKDVEGFPDYQISDAGRVARIDSPSKPLAISADGKVQMYVNGKQFKRSVDKLLRSHFRKKRDVVIHKIEASDEVRWRKIPGFPDYWISNYGEVQRVVDRKDIRPTGPFQREVRLWHNGQQHTRGIRKLTREAFGSLSKY